MNASEEQDIVCGCRGRADLEKVVSLLDRAFEKTPLEYFERHVLRDPTLQPDDTRILIHNGDIVSTVQIFPRVMAIAGEHMIFGGIGNVGTDPRERRKGLAERVMQDAIRMMKERNYHFSMLETTINPYYERFGYKTVVREVAVLSPPAGPVDTGVRRFRKEEDLQRIKELYSRYNETTVGPLVRDDLYWEAQLAFCGEDPEKFLVLERDGELIGYMRARVYKGYLEVLEYAAEGDIPSVFTALLRAVGRLAAGIPVKFHLPDSERHRICLIQQYAILEDTDLMVLSLSDRFRSAGETLVTSRNAINFWRSDFF